MPAAVAVNYSSFDFNRNVGQAVARGVITMDAAYPAGGEATAWLSSINKESYIS